MSLFPDLVDEEEDEVERTTTLRLEIELTYDGDIMHGDDVEAIEWFRYHILMGAEGKLLLHSNEIGDEIGTVRGLRILGVEK
jgi:hypothetical protein